MRVLLVIAFALLLAGQLGAETYSWVDETGTYNFTEDLSQVPKKYRKNVTRRGDMGRQDAAPTASPANASPEKSRQTEDANGKPGGLPGGDTQLYGGKTQDAWRKELQVHESELARLEQQLDQLQKQIKKPSGVSFARQSELIKEYEKTRGNYNQKYKIYSELIESARKAGLVIEIRK